jgi:glutathionylspermidine synthase
VLGRLSSNIRIHNGLGELEHESQGGYEDCERVYQEFCPPHRVEGRNNFILGMWMVSEARTLLSGHVGHAATMCIREFDAPVLELTNERFIPHIVI